MSSARGSRLAGRVDHVVAVAGHGVSYATASAWRVDPLVHDGSGRTGVLDHAPAEVHAVAALRSLELQGLP
jgi:hypothetical protein